jgi:ribA/ribD-fused uncharacterized protein
MSTVIGFWKPEQANGHFSQWYPSPLVINNMKYSCAEQYYMLQKALAFDDREAALKILSTSNPQTMKNYGKQIKGFSDQVWDQSKYRVALEGNRAKFSQNPALKQKLLETGSAVLAELSPYDKIWGVGSSSSNPKFWKGQNLLGQVLMQVRQELRTE